MTASLLFVSELLGLIPDNKSIELESRKHFAEVFAIQLSSLAYRGQESTIDSTLKLLVDRHTELESAAILTSGRDFIVGDHREFWLTEEQSVDRDSSSQVSVPIFKHGLRWGTVELRFARQESTGLRSWLHNNPILALVAFVTISGFVAYRLFMKRALRELDPSAAIPDRVRTAFDALAEGVLILDEQQEIVLANQAFLAFVDKEVEQLVGNAASVLNWSGNSGEQLPWSAVFTDNESRTGERLLLNQHVDNERVFIVNCVPIHDGDGQARGVLATFDDVSEMEEKNNSLKLMLGKLQMSQQRVEAQNKKLHVMATRDPMTNCLNRRAFYSAFEHKFADARTNRTDLSAIMVDIDFFKSINDNFGHGAGDEVIKVLAQVLHDNCRDIDLVARYGGEEFALILVGLDATGAESVANRIRNALKTSDAPNYAEGKVITASLGVSTISHGAKDKEALLDEADQALYVAKESGRDRVVCWSPELQSEKAGLISAAITNGSMDEPIALMPGQLQNQEAAANDEKVDGLLARIDELEQLSSEKSNEVTALLQYDALTGMQNRDPFHEKIGAAIARGYRYENLTAVLSIGVNSYTNVKDTLGHQEADIFLGEIAIRLDSVLRSSDTVVSVEGSNSFLELSRLSSDEFGVLLSDLESRETIGIALERIVTAITQPIELQSGRITPECAVGVSVFPDDGAYAELLTHTAALARQQASLGSEQCCFYSEDLQLSATQRLLNV
ncbi:MAG: diguanylate cyclase [Pseudomonadales bacterium]